MANNRDVTLVVRAKDQASKELGNVNSALKKLAEAQTAAAASSGSAAGTMGKLAAESKKLAAEVEGLASLQKVAGQIDKAAAAVTRLEAGVAKSREELQRLSGTQADAASKVAQLTTTAGQATAALNAQKAAVAAAKLEQKAAGEEVAKASERYRTLMAAVKAAKNPSDELKQSLRDQRDALVALTIKQEQSVAATQTAVAQQKALATAATALGSSLKTARDAEAGLTSDVDKAAGALARQKADLAGSTANLGTMQAGANAAAAGLRQTTMAENELAAAAKKAAEDLARVNAALARQSQPSAPGARPITNGGPAIGTAPASPSSPSADSANAYRAQVKAISDTGAAYAAARAEASRLGAEMARTAAPTRELETSFQLAKAASAAAKAEWLAAGQALSNTRNAMLAAAEAARKKAEADRVAAAAAAAEAAAVAEAKAKKLAEAEASKAAAEAKRAEAKARKEAAAALRAEEAGRRATLDVGQRMISQVRAMVTAYVGLGQAIAQIGKVIAAYQQIEAAQSRINVATGADSGKTAQELDFIRRNADRLGISYGTLASEYGKFLIATKGTNLEGAKSRQLFIAISEAGRVNKLTTEQMTGAYLAFTQMISKSKIMSEELKGQLAERLPGAMRLFADAIGISVSELEKQLQKGLSADVLDKVAVQLQKTYGPALAASLLTTTTAMGQFENAVLQSRVAFAEGGFIEPFTQALRSMTEYLNSPEGVQGMVSLGKAAGGVVTALVAVAEQFRYIAVAASTFAGMKIGVYITQAFVAVRTAIIAAAATLATFGAAAQGAAVAVSAMTGGLSIVLGLAAAGLAYWATSTDDATKAMVEHKQIVDQVKNAYDAAGGKTEEFKKAISGITTGDVEANLTELRKVAVEKFSDMSEAASTFKGKLDKLAQRNPALTGNINDLKASADELQAGSLSVEQFRVRVDNAARAMGNPAIRKWGNEVAAAAKESNGASKSVGEMKLVLDAVSGSADVAATALAKLNGTVGDNGAKFKESAAAAEKYAKAIDDIKSNVPALKAESDRDKKLRELEDTAKQLEIDAKVGGKPFGEAEKKLIEQAKQAVLDQYSATQITNLPGVTPGYYSRVIQNESGGNTSAKAPGKGMTASGLAGFTDGTWLGLFDRVFPDLANLEKAAKLALKSNAESSKKMLERLTKENESDIIRYGNGVPVNDTSLYAMHHFGGGRDGGGLKLLRADPNTQVSGLLSDAAIKGNKGVISSGEMTAGQLIAKLAKMMGGAGGQGGVSTVQSGDLTDNGRTTEENDANAKAKQREKEKQDYQEKFDLQKQTWAAEEETLTAKTLETRVAFEVEKERLKQQAIGLTMSKEDLEVVRQHAELSLKKKYDDAAAAAATAAAAEVTKKQNAMNKDLSHLKDLRGDLNALKEIAQNNGDMAGVAEIDGKLVALDARFKEVIATAREYWKAVGGDEADKRLAELDLVDASLAKQKNKFDDKASEINSSFMSSVSGAFNTLAESLANGENALESFGNFFRKIASDFLMQIAQMILKQALLNAMTAAFGAPNPNGSGSLGGIIMSAVGGALGGGSGTTAVLHDGGIAGSAGGVSRGGVSNSIFASARRFHSGGLPGLDSTEVPAILQKGEEVLTRNDPRNILNGGGAGGMGGGASPANVKIVNTFDAGSFVSEGLNSAVGEQSFLNFVRANSGSVRSALGV